MRRLEGLQVRLSHYKHLYAGRLQDGFKYVLYIISSDAEPQGERYFKSSGALRRYAQEAGIKL